jgi:G3E family GTPase
MPPTTPITALCGFLGSGKTTLLRRWRRQPGYEDAALIIHDFSEVGLDADLLAGDDTTPVPGQLTGRIAALHGIHARQTLHTSVQTALDGILTLDPPAPHVLVESTGAARPWPLIEALTQDDRFTLRHFIVAVDALNLHRDFADGRALTGEADLRHDPALQQAAEVLAEQILFANVVVLTKVDALPEAVVQEQVARLQQLRPNAAIGLSAYGGLTLDRLADVPAPDLPERKVLAQRFGLDRRPPTADLASLVLRDPRPFHPVRLFDACQQHLGTGVYRTKGYVWLASRPEHLLLWQQSGSQVGFEIRGYWLAEAARDPELRPDEVAALRARLDAHDPVFGDRRNELTVLGEPRACRVFLEALEAALCTDDEVAAWQRGEGFADPWPRTVKRFDG